MSWLADIFAQAELLQIVADYLFWSPSPRHCMACGLRDLTAAPDFGRFLMCCRWLSNCLVNDAAFDNAQDDIPPAVRFNQDGRWRAVRRLRYLTHVRMFDIEELLMDMADMVMEQCLAEAEALDMDWLSVLDVSTDYRRARYEALVSQFLKPDDLCDWHIGREDIRRKIVEMHVEWTMAHEFTEDGG